MNMDLVIGEILKPQGIRGELKAKPFTDDASVFKSIRRVFIGGTEYQILTVRGGDGFVYLGLRGVPDRNAAELLRGKEIVIPRSEAPEPPAGSYYIADLLGCEIVTREGERLGTLTQVRQAATDIYTLEADGKEIMFPAAKGVVLSVEPENGKIVVDGKRFHEVAVD